MSATSRRPALIAWTSSPISGASRTTVVSAAAATSTSLWPVPTVSSRMTSKPAASSTVAAATDEAASPPAWPREAMLRMKTPSSAAYDCIRTRSPRSAPPVIGDDGSTAMTATDRPPARSSPMSAATSVLLPAPGAPVIPTRCARPARGCSRRRADSATGVRFSTAVSSRARARRSPVTAASASAIPRSAAASAGASTGVVSPAPGRWPGGSRPPGRSSSPGRRRPRRPLRGGPGRRRRG